MTQPNPKKGRKSVHAFVLRLLAARRKRGIETYGTVLMSHNGRDALWDAIEECADLLNYLCQEWMEKQDAKSGRRTGRRS